MRNGCIPRISDSPNCKNGRLPIARKPIARMPIARMAFEVYFSKMYLQHIDRMWF